MAVIGDVVANLTRNVSISTVQAGVAGAISTTRVGVKIDANPVTFQEQLDSMAAQSQAIGDAVGIARVAKAILKATGKCVDHFLVSIPLRWINSLLNQPKFLEHPISTIRKTDPSLEVFDGDPISSVRTCIEEQMDESSKSVMAINGFWEEMEESRTALQDFETGLYAQYEAQRNKDRCFASLTTQEALDKVDELVRKDNPTLNCASASSPKPEPCAKEMCDEHNAFERYTKHTVQAEKSIRAAASNGLSRLRGETPHHRSRSAKA